jgi:SAM-dependent methyltransferase
MTPAILAQSGLDTAALQSMLYGDIDGYALSSRGRERAGIHSENMTYGEVTPEVMELLMTAANAKPGESFYDLGAGTGKGVLYSALMSDLGRCTGIELLPELHEASKLAQSRYMEHLLPKLPDHKKAQQIDFLCGDMLQIDFSDADIIFTHCTCFSAPLMDAITEKFNKLKKGARVITVSKGLTSPYYAATVTNTVQMAWGTATAYMYEKVA